MAVFYDSVEWYNVAYKIRRPINFLTFDRFPGLESLLAVKLTPEDINYKIKADYSDLLVVRSQGLVNIEELPFYVLQEPGNLTTIIFESDYPVTEDSVDKYTLYYNNKSQSYVEGDVLLLQPPILDKTDLLGELSSSRMSFTRPTEDWSSNSSNVPNAKAVFDFIGHQSQFVFQKGPDRGILRYTIDDIETVLLDLYDAQDSDYTLQIDNDAVNYHKIRFEVSGEKNPASSDIRISLSEIKYQDILVGQLESEQYYTSSSSSFLVGS